MSIARISVGPKEHLVFVEDENYLFLKGFIGEQWAKYAYMRRLEYGENTVKCGKCIVRWQTSPDQRDFIEPRAWKPDGYELPPSTSTTHPQR